jgi:hypothetical protein
VHQSGVPAGGKGWLHPFLPTDGASLPILTVPRPTWVDPEKRAITTSFVTLPRFVEVPQGNPADPRIDDIGGDLTPEWGLHLVDATLRWATCSRSHGVRDTLGAPATDVTSSEIDGLQPRAQDQVAQQTRRSEHQGDEQDGRQAIAGVRRVI